MDAVKIYNIIEIFLWLGFSVIFWIPALRRDEKRRAFCITGAVTFMVISASEVVEVYTGAWWRPWWLLVWKASPAVVFALMGRWYLRIIPDWQEKVFGKGKGKRSENNPPNGQRSG